MKARISVVAGVLSRGGKVFIARRNQGSLAGVWEFPGGQIEKGETPEVALARELSEELSITAKIGKKLGDAEHANDEREIALAVYWVDSFSGEITLLDHDAMAWVTPDELKNYDLAPADVPFIPTIKAILKK